MKIKKLELIGFKSFKDKTVIMFDKGITGIVGPNGCGKSNIVDALVWVMGEMSAKNLRGGKMEDVIFAGSQDYSPSGMAEVSLVLENDGGSFPVRYLNHSEVMVTRRLHRGGDTEYFINREPCRLRDIQEIFMDTGAGSKGFSIIEQGQIGKIITSKPYERRSLIEEAAGITKFKARKRESERKLKSTDQNLLRLADIIRELKRQLGSLERQAQKAERYKKLKDSLREKELWLSSVKVSAGQEEFGKLQEQITDLSDQESQFDSEIQSLQAQIEEEKTKSLDKEKALEEKQIEFKMVSDAVLAFENEIRDLEFEIEQTKRSQEIKGSVNEQNQARLQVVQTEREDVETKYYEVKENFELIDEEYLSLDEKFQFHQSEINEKEELLTVSRKAQLETHQGLSHLQVAAAGLSEKVENLNREIEVKEETKREIEDVHKDFFKRFNSLSKDYESEQQLKLELVKDTEVLSQNLSKLKEAQEELYGQREKENASFNLADSKLKSLEELQEQFEGYQEGVRNLLMARKDKNFGERGAPLSDWIKLPEEYEKSVESSLGDALQGLFGVSSLEEISQSVSFMGNEKQGRVQFFVNEFICEEGLRNQGEVKTLADFMLKSNDAAENILKLFYLVKDLDEAKVLFQKAHGFCITLKGEVVSSLGQLFLGNSGEGVGLLARKQNIEELTREVAKRKTLLDVLEKDLALNKKQVIKVSEELEAAKVKDNEQEFRVFELQKDLERSEYEKEKSQVEINKVLKLVDEMKEKVKGFSEKHEEQVHAIRDLEVKKEEQEKESIEAEEILVSLKDNYSDLQNEVTEKKVLHASLRSEFESLEQRLESLKNNEEQLSSEIESLEEESQSSSSFISGHSTQLAENQAKLSLDIENRLRLEKTVAEMRDEYEKWTQAEREMGKKVTENTLEKSKVSSQLSDCQLKSEQIRLGLQSSIDQIFDRYNVDLTEKYGEYTELYEESEEENVKESVYGLKQKISSMGEVNLSAISEYDDINNRHSFLSDQQSDLLKAKNQLEKVILRIDRICSRRFRDTFEAVNERFKKVFPVLFGGGEAQLTLVEQENNDQEPGIDIEAKPPGKKVQNVSLLSGGEKALTAVSLIFSIFLVKPSPYCLLDEVDAPLDDANVFRFNDLVKEMAKRSQLILVTHNKNTMAVNNKLYGVTQEERGVSKMVSVDLDGNFLKEVQATA